MNESKELYNCYVLAFGVDLLHLFQFWANDMLASMCVKKVKSLQQRSSL
jgi:hypothetical protein